MARVAVTPIKSVSPYGPGPGAGIAAKAADPAEFNSFVNDGRTYLVVANANAATKTLKLKSSAGTQIGPTYTLPAEKTIVVGPFPVFEQFGEVVNLDANHADVTFIAVSQSQTASTLR
jgi:hypothetical protein